MTLILTRKDLKTTCDHCGHWKTRHTKEVGCLVCAFAQKQGKISLLQICRELFPSRLPAIEIEQAKKGSKESYEFGTICASCREIWGSHEGYLCPNGMTVFIPQIGDVVVQ